MRVTQEQMRENRHRILSEASRLFREKGFDAVGIAEVMKAAGLTHGGFYGHFASKEELMAHAIAQATTEVSGRCDDPQTLVAKYLSPAHRDNVADGCPMAALAADVRHRPPATRSAMSVGIRSQIDGLARALPDDVTADRRREAIGTYAAMLGALILARAVDEPTLSDEILSETRAWMATAP
ncbi:TetR/AcrR family transcriptional regulator [Methylobacterium sp. W2]|uniref:TetR/AcrR family transcriptional regulator n=1 Tax=Methylobacterium sp. W2 TaxID=2598107 RepID=UPI001D0BF6A5|nr:TetR/AcrR family transcriptional regulator [Methylobacterium sp. W2]MCC0804983.1 TetR/AcrR family transcriptional regulator [Methylobacterium sp. W2]